MRYVILIFILCLVSISCSSKNEVKNVDTNLVEYGQIDGQKIGLNDKREIIIQKETTAEGELKVQQLENYETERKLQVAYESLSQCRSELADPRLGGNGKVQEIPDVDGMKSVPETREEIGLTKSDELKVVKRESYLETLKLERQYGETMKEMLKTFQKFTLSCNQEMAFARVSHGLPAERYEGEGRFDGSGNWIVTRRPEKNLDEAFVLRASLAKTEEK